MRLRCQRRAGAAGSLRGGVAGRTAAGPVGAGHLRGGIQVQRIGAVDQHQADRGFVFVDLGDAVDQRDLGGRDVGGAAEVGGIRWIGHQGQAIGAQLVAGLGAGGRAGIDHVVRRAAGGAAIAGDDFEGAGAAGRQLQRHDAVAVRRGDRGLQHAVAAVGTHGDTDARARCEVQAAHFDVVAFLVEAARQRQLGVAQRGFDERTVLVRQVAAVIAGVQAVVQVVVRIDVPAAVRRTHRSVQAQLGDVHPQRGARIIDPLAAVSLDVGVLGGQARFHDRRFDQRETLVAAIRMGQRNGQCRGNFAVATLQRGTGGQAFHAGLVQRRGVETLELERRRLACAANRQRCGGNGRALPVRRGALDGHCGIFSLGSLRDRRDSGEGKGDTERQGGFHARRGAHLLQPAVVRRGQRLDSHAISFRDLVALLSGFLVVSVCRDPFASAA
jgi:hypothetical protein